MVDGAKHLAADREGHPRLLEVPPPFRYPNQHGDYKAPLVTLRVSVLLNSTRAESHS
jgi:hypothetical protein